MIAQLRLRSTLLPIAFFAWRSCSENRARLHRATDFSLVFWTLGPQRAIIPRSFPRGGVVIFRPICSRVEGDPRRPQWQKHQISVQSYLPVLFVVQGPAMSAPQERAGSGRSTPKESESLRRRMRQTNSTSLAVVKTKSGKRPKALADLFTAPPTSAGFHKASSLCIDYKSYRSNDLVFADVFSLQAITQACAFAPPFRHQ